MSSFSGNLRNLFPKKWVHCHWRRRKAYFLPSSFFLFDIVSIHGQGLFSPGFQYIRLALSLITCYHQHFPSKFRSFVGHCSQNSSYFLTSLKFQIYWALNITLRSCTAPPNTKMMTRVVPCPSHFVPDWGPVYPKPKLEVFRTGHAIGDGSCVIYAFQAGFPD